MPIKRVFLPWRRPPLESAANYLIDRYRYDNVVAMRNTIVITPVISAARRLLEILLEKTEAAKLVLDPPDIETVGYLPEKLYKPKLPFASRLVQQLAWTRTLHDSAPERLSNIVAHRPDPNDATSWMNLGDLLRTQHIELAADSLDFSDVMRRGPEVEGFRELERWRSMRELQEHYLRLLDSLKVWDLQTARLFAIKKREFKTTRDIVLIGAVDLNVAMRQMLDQVAERVSTLIHAPEEWAERFDEHGCVIPEKWLEASIEVRDDQLIFVDGPDDQAEIVVRRLAEYGGRYAPDDIAIGLPDPLLAPHIQRQLHQVGVETHVFDGRRMLDSAPCRLLSALASYLERGHYADFAAMVRHPDLHDWLVQQTGATNYLAELDALYGERLPSRIRDDAFEDPSIHPAAARVYESITTLLAPLVQESRRLHDWTRPITMLLAEVYRGREFDRTDHVQDEALTAFVRMQRVLSEHELLPVELSPRLTAAEAIRYTLDQLTGEMLASRQESSAVEMLGWLDLPLDDAPAVIVTSFNEGRVPSSASADLFLPNELRRLMGVSDNDRRYARDAYALCSILASREDVALIVAKRDTQSNPMPPSRLLFATDEETIALRAKRFFSSLAPTVKPHPLIHVESSVAKATNTSDARQLTLDLDRDSTLSKIEARGSLETPRPVPLAAPINAMSVTSFKEYLACPYRFYLKRVLRLEAIDDAATELDASGFGTLLHDVLESFGQNENAREWKDSEKVLALLHANLNDLVRKRHGEHPLPAVRVQVEQIRHRLKSFAVWQADWVARGWRIKYTETNQFRETPYLDVDGERMYLRARLDRVDYHAKKNEWYILDYKSGEAGETPDQIHRYNEKWHDLQLPLYRELARFLGVVGKVHLGYILIPKDVGRIGLAPAEWSESDLAQALQTAREVVRKVRRQEFWPPTAEPPDFSDEFAAICQDRVIKPL